MTLTSIGDLARGLTLRARSTDIKTQIETLSHEMSTGRVQDISGRLGGDYAYLLELDRGLERLDAYAIATTEARLFTEAMQTSVKTIAESTSDMSADLLSFGTSNQAVTHQQASVQARNQLDTMVSALNARTGGRSLFSGTATDVSPLPDADSILSSLQSELTGLVTTSAIRQAADNWMNDPTKFDAVIYGGSANALAPMQISDGEQIDLPITALDPAIKAAIRDVALTALVADAALGFPPSQRTALFKDLGVDLAGATDELVKLRGEIGTAEARIEQADTRNTAARTSTEFARNELIAADPYETAARLQTVQFQLESLYAVTVRNANLSLVNFLR